jgi:hypothetical protein
MPDGRLNTGSTTWISENPQEIVERYDKIEEMKAQGPQMEPASPTQLEIPGLCQVEFL